jgi:hypothetical protein
MTVSIITMLVFVIVWTAAGQLRRSHDSVDD